ncbi:Membrane protein [Mycena indigotica]|uniref:Membrane protein n=1 Tax=Mycena indigotica TaxID=2126181 RepID=A0A8H6SWH7_9AGAR|nr:Membrane protein [Mycena indigotica]KAF7306649.1 Membrane protein [Mycena indigotica]
MALPDISLLSLSDDPGGPSNTQQRYADKYLQYLRSLPYTVEPESKILELLDFIVLRLTQAVSARDYEVGFLQWDTMLTHWSMLKYELPKETRVRLAKIYWHLSVLPGAPTPVMAAAADGFKALTSSTKKISIKDMRLPWRPIFDILSKEMFLTRRQFEYTQIPWVMGYIAANSRRFFHPAAINEMLSVFVPLINGTDLDYMLAAQFYMLNFLPISHPQSYLPMLFRLWESVNSHQFDERMLDFLANVTELHVAADVSDPRHLAEIPDDAKSEGESRPQWNEDDIRPGPGQWTGIYQDVGIFTEQDWSLIMFKCLSSMEIGLADGGSLSTGSSADRFVAAEIGRLPKPEWRIESLARIIVYSMAPDGVPTPPSNAPTPMFTPLPSGMNTPQIPTSNSIQDYLSAPLARRNGGITTSKYHTYLAGSKSLDSLSRVIASLENFFHPSNSGNFTTSLAAFIKYVAYDFNKRWMEEQQPDCKTPRNRRLTRQMRRELVKTLRTVALLAIFNEDSTVVSNIQSCLKSMSVMEPDLIVHPILERAVPALETLVETQRTIAVIKALGAIAPAIVSRKVYYPGAKHLVPILQMLENGIDINDPTKTLHTTQFLVEISQCIMFSDSTPEHQDSESMSRTTVRPSLIPAFSLDEDDDTEFPRLSDAEEDASLQDTTGSFADWVSSFIRRVYLLQESLPDEGGGSSEVDTVDAVGRACSAIVAHLSEPLYDLVLNMVYDYVSTHVRANAVRGIHLLVESLANASPAKCMAKFFPLCEKQIRLELENGASSLRTTAASSPLPSDATLHWHLAILRGCVYNDGNAILPYQDRLIDLLCLLHEHCRSNRGFTWSAKLLSGSLLTLTHTYPLENKFVNQDEWDSPEFRKNHHLYWGKVYKVEDVKISWHVPNAKEIDCALRMFKRVVEPTLDTLEQLLNPDTVRNAIWSNDFCRHISFVTNAFSGIPTLFQDVFDEKALRKAMETSDILCEINEMIGVIEPIESGFVLTDPTDPRYAYISSLRRRFGEFLHNASRSLTQQGEENTVDAVEMLLDGIRSFMLDYGDGRDGYHTNEKKYAAEKNIARHFAKQKEWPRSVWIRRARFYHSARLHWNSAERLRGPLEDLLIDDLVEWSLWNYATIRSYGQSILESICSLYDGVRQRTLPTLYKALDPGTDDDRMKGALWTLNLVSFGKYAASELLLAPELVQKLFSCQHNEKPSIQDAVSTVAENCLNNLPEPCFLAYDIPTPELDAVLPVFQPEQLSIIRSCTEKRKERVALMNRRSYELTEAILAIGNKSSTHWKYEIAAVRCLRTIIRRDVAQTPEQIRYFISKTNDSNPNMRYYSQRSAMKSLRNLKIKTFARSPKDLALGRNHNPLCLRLPVTPTHQFTHQILHTLTIPPDLSDVNLRFLDKDPLPGWLTWPTTIALYKPPHPEKSTFLPWDNEGAGTVAVVREIAMTASFWEQLSTFYSEENSETNISLDNGMSHEIVFPVQRQINGPQVSYIKSIFQLLEDEPFEVLEPTLVSLLSEKEPDKQRALAEFLAGLIGGSKHWPLSKQRKLWDWFKPVMAKIFNENLKTDTITIWESFLAYLFHNKDPRRLQPLVDHIMQLWLTMDFQPELTFDATKILSIFKAFFQELNWKFTSWMDPVVERCWKQLEVRNHIADVLLFASIIKARPAPSEPTTETFVRECRVLPADHDIMGMRGQYHRDKILALVQKFSGWREERIPGVRAFQSTYDRMGITICTFLFEHLLEPSAIAVFDYIVPLMPELFRFTEVNDNEDLATRGNDVLVQMCGVNPPRQLINPIIDGIFDTIQNSPSWRVRLKALPLVQVFYFRQMPRISEGKVLSRCLDDEVVDVREMAATTLSGVLRLSPRRHILTLRDRFVQLIRKSHLPPRSDPSYARSIRQRHAAILGVCALVESSPYTVEKWTPGLLTDILAEHTYDPAPISTTVRKTARNFSRTHRDTWHEDSARFNEDQLAALSTLLTGSSYYA